MSPATRCSASDPSQRVSSALSLLKLQEQGKVDIHSKVADVAPEVKIVNQRLITT
jgi:hypothetical protein